MSGPVTTQDTPATAEASPGAVEGEVELERGRETMVGALPVRPVPPPWDLGVGMESRF